MHAKENYWTFQCFEETITERESFRLFTWQRSQWKLSGQAPHCTRGSVWRHHIVNSLPIQSWYNWSLSYHQSVIFKLSQEFISISFHPERQTFRVSSLLSSCFVLNSLCKSTCWKELNSKSWFSSIFLKLEPLSTPQPKRSTVSKTPDLFTTMLG